jgi:hypothetical protein
MRTLRYTLVDCRNYNRIIYFTKTEFIEYTRNCKKHINRVPQKHSTISAKRKNKSVKTLEMMACFVIPAIGKDYRHNEISVH